MTDLTTQRARLLAYAMTLTRNLDAAEDLTQTAYLLCWERYGALEYPVLSQTIYNRWVHEGRRNRVIVWWPFRAEWLGLTSHDGKEGLQRVPAALIAPDHAGEVITRMERRAVQRTMGLLSPGYRRALYEVYWQELPMSGYPTRKSQAQRGRKRFAELWVA